MNSQEHNHGHNHGDGWHVHAPADRMKNAFFLTLAILIVELTGGLISHSLALLSDAGHVLTDIAAIGLSWFAMHQAEKPADRNMTFGYYRYGILAALVNSISLILITIWILWEAYGRFQHPQPVRSTWMFISAAVGLLINLYLGLSMRKEENINVRSAVIHILGDAAASAGVIAGGLIILFTRWYVIDPILSIFIALLIAAGAWKIVRQAMVILLEGTPQGIDFQKVINEIQVTPGVDNVHDLHIWSITSGKNALSCHIVCANDITIRESQAILREIERRLVHLGIEHVTIQLEDARHPHGDSVLCSGYGTQKHHEH